MRSTSGAAAARQHSTSTIPTTRRGHVLGGELTFRYDDRTETVGPGMTVFVPAGVAHTYTAGGDAHYLIILTPRLRALITALQADRAPARQREIYRRFDSELLE